MKVLVLSPHTDDAEVGCGATMAKHVANGDEVKCVVFSDCKESLPEEMRNPNQLLIEHIKAMKILGVLDLHNKYYPVRLFRKYEHEIRDLIYKLVHKEFKPDIVYTPWLGSLHQDHEVIARCTEQVCRHKDITVLGYYVCDDGIGFAPRYFEGLSLKLVDKKLDALFCYESQVKLRSWWTQPVFESYMRYWSPSTSHQWTEAFEIIRMVKL